MKLPKRIRKRYAAAVLLLPLAGGWTAVRPSNDRDWTAENAVLPAAEFRGDSVRVRNVRNNHYVTADQFVVRHEDRAYDLRELESAWFVVEPFAKDWRGPAHTLVSFGFRDGRYLAVSVEVRKEKGESYSPLKGVLKRFEITYVVADERDVVRLRTNIRRDPVHLYPMRAEPEFYNTLTNTCTTNLVRHVNRITPERVPFSYKVLLPGYSDRLAYDLGLIDTDLPFEEARERFHINARAAKYADAPDFSQRIRQIE